ncbi:MAG: hypothetical protein HC938_17375 [Nitrospira sp.]|nr:hypothetical protein [Nitrospira sp.]
MDTSQHKRSLSERLGNGADKMAQRMGGQFVKNERWGNVVAASAIVQKTVNKLGS